MGLTNSKFLTNPNVAGSSYYELLQHFVTTCLSTRRGRILMVLWGTGGIGSVLVGFYQKFLRSKQYIERKKKEKEHVQRKEASDELQKHKERLQQERRPPGLVKQLRDILQFAFPSTASGASAYLVAYTITLIARILLTIKIAELTGRLGKMVGAREFSGMFHSQVIFALWCMPAAIVNSLLPYFCDKLSLSIRSNLLRYLHNTYLSNLIFYRASNIGSQRIEDIDHRATQDLKKFSSSVSELYGNLLKPVLEVVLLSHTLAKLMGGKQLMGFFAFFIVAGQWLRFVMPPFAEMTRDSQKLEGEFRSHHHRLIAHSEEIAFYGGSEREKDIVNNSFKSIIRLSNKQFTLQGLMSVLDTYLVKYGASMVAYSMMIPAVYLGLQGLKGKSTADIMQYYLTSTQIFLALGAACKHLVLSYKRIQALSGLTIRIWELFRMFKERNNNEDEKEMMALAAANPNRVGGPPKVIIGDEIEFNNVDIFSPTGQLLLKGLNFKVAKNNNVLISGRNGSGKSSLFRVLGGLWPLCSGTLTKPPLSKLFYIPQKPYMCPGTLRDQVTYPLSFNSNEHDKKLEEIMNLVSLNYLVDREGGWSSVRDWMDVLSGGEKQRIAMARLFFHKPAFGILDECTSAVSQDVEAKIYETCSSLGITIFTVSHRPQLRHHHDYELKFDGEGGWQWNKLEKEN